MCIKFERLNFFFSFFSCYLLINFFCSVVFFLFFFNYFALRLNSMFIRRISSSSSSTSKQQTNYVYIKILKVNTNNYIYYIHIYKCVYLLCTFSFFFLFQKCVFKNLDQEKRKRKEENRKINNFCCCCCCWLFWLVLRQRTVLTILVQLDDRFDLVSTMHTKVS